MDAFVVEGASCIQIVYCVDGGVTSTHELGHSRNSHQSRYGSGRAWAVLAILATIEVLLDCSIRRLEAYVLRWRPLPREL